MKIQKCDCSKIPGGSKKVTYTFKEYCKCADLVFKGEEIAPEFMRKFSKLLKFFAELKNRFIDDFPKGIFNSMGEFVTILSQVKTNGMFAVFKAFDFAVTKIVNTLNLANKLLNDGVMNVLKLIAQPVNLNLLKKKVVKVQDWVNKFPILKKLSGPVIAVLLLWLWSGMTLKFGKLPVLVDVAERALLGAFTYVHLLTTPEGLQFFTFLGLANLGVPTPTKFLLPGLFTFIVIWSLTHNKALQDKGKLLLSKLKSVPLSRFTKDADKQSKVLSSVNSH